MCTALIDTNQFFAFTQGYTIDALINNRKPPTEKQTISIKLPLIVTHT